VDPASKHHGRFSLGKFSLHGKKDPEEGVAWNGEGEMVSGGTYKVGQFLQFLVVPRAPPSPFGAS